MESLAATTHPKQCKSRAQRLSHVDYVGILPKSHLRRNAERSSTGHETSGGNLLTRLAAFMVVLVKSGIYLLFTFEY